MGISNVEKRLKLQIFACNHTGNLLSSALWAKSECSFSLYYLTISYYEYFFLSCCAIFADY